ncbi:Ribonuclease [Quillaja saponaria]|uniref:Ribonuclease n=1 Tax=Quillaja saponaria TaxID=32244 RepID=A0AAD7M6C0_QUISA|nr:Ribonuclease [Quillaja saponaria]
MDITMNCKLVLMAVYLLLVGFLISCEGQPNRQYDYFRLALRWPNSYCRSNNCRQTVPQYFTIHGLWPQKNDGSELSNCNTTEQLTDALLNNFKSDLPNYWPDLSTTYFEASKGFWRYQWTKHGSCSSSKFKPSQWVERAITLTKTHDVLSMLKKAGILPNGASYTTSKILKAIQDGTSKPADIVCNKDKNGNMYLFEVRLCFDYDANAITNCQNKARQCDAGRNPIFPSTPRPTNITTGQSAGFN